MAATTASSRQRQLFADEPFWHRFSPHHELPLSTVSSFSLHGLIVGLLILIALLGFKLHGDAGGRMPIGAVVLAGGGSHSQGIDNGPGVRAPGSDGALDELPAETTDSFRVGEPLRDKLLEVRKAALHLPEFKDSRRLIQEGGQAVTAALNLSQEMRKKLNDGLVAGQGKKGPGSDGGDGNGRSPGTGDQDGPGTNTANIRNQKVQRLLRWTMLFNTRDGQDYCRQLVGLGAILAIPDPVKPDRYLIIRDLTAQPVEPREEDLAQIQRIYWIDDKPSSIQSLAGALGLQPIPSRIVAFFPEGLEKKLLDLELNFRHHKEEDIVETRFEIRLTSAGHYEPMVISQRP